MERLALARKTNIREPYGGHLCGVMCYCLFLFFYAVYPLLYTRVYTLPS